MKTRCPDCQTTFRVSPEQLKARAGKVRCGQCQSVFNALDSLLEENSNVALSATTQPEPPLARISSSDSVETPFISPSFSANEPAFSIERADKNTVNETASLHNTYHAQEQRIEPAIEHPSARTTESTSDDCRNTPGPEVSDPNSSEPGTATQIAETPVPSMSEATAQELGKATGLILPRETTQIPGYSKWAEGVMTTPLTLPAEKPSRWPFILATLLLLLALGGQLAFRFRSEIAVALPSLRPTLEALCQALNAELPLPRHVELVSIETSDLQTDAAHGNLLVLNATLRNRANYGQAYPALELSLTDTQDAAIARRVFLPSEYLSPKLAENKLFSANSDAPVRVWIEAKEISAAGYRLYVFYP